jgi:hypothetical protein
MRRPWRARSPLMFGHDWSSPDSLAVVQGVLKSGLYVSPVPARSTKDRSSEAVQRDDQVLLPPEWQWPGTEAERGAA